MRTAPARCGSSAARTRRSGSSTGSRPPTSIPTSRSPPRSARACGASRTGSSPTRRSPAMPMSSRAAPERALPRDPVGGGAAAARIGGGARAVRRRVRRPLCGDARMGGARGAQGGDRLAARPLFRDHLSWNEQRSMRRLSICIFAGRRPRICAAAARDAARRGRTRGRIERGAARRQREWARRPARGALRAILRASSTAMEALNPEIVPELAWQMGRPVRYGGELRSLAERVRAMVDAAPRRAGAGRAPATTAPAASSTRVPAGLVLVDRALELSLPHRRQHDRRRPCSPAMRCCSSTPPRPCWPASASPQALAHGRACPRGCSPTCSSSHDGPRALLALRRWSTMPPSPARSRAAGRSSAPRPGQLHHADPRAGRQGPGLCPRRRRSRRRRRGPGRRQPSTIAANPAARSSASTSTRRCGSPSSTASSRRRGIPARRPARPGDQPRADGERKAARRRSARRSRQALAAGATAHVEPQLFPRRRPAARPI